MKEKLEQANQFIEENKGTINDIYRQCYHLMAPVGWMNDPNGFVYYKGEYHLFYQYYPYDSVWGPMHWGHAKSKDLIHWQELPVALAPSEEYDLDGCFSGSAIEKDGKLFLMYTGHYEREGIKREVQCIAVSDDGIHFEKFSGNPVISDQHIKGIAPIEDFRDPKIEKRNGIYYSVIASKTTDQRGQILLFQSEDLFLWKFTSVLLTGKRDQGIMWECPDLFHLDGKDVLLISPIEMKKKDNLYENINSTVAFIGEVDWLTGRFIVENHHEIDFGLDFYAPQTCVDDQGQRIMVAWMQMWGRNMPTNDLGHFWAGAMTLPRELHVVNKKLIQQPINTIYELIMDKKTIIKEKLEDSSVELDDNDAKQFYIEFSGILRQTKTLTIKVLRTKESSVELIYDPNTDYLSISRDSFGLTITGNETEQLTKRTASVPLLNDRLVLEIFRDTSSIEVFANEIAVMSMNFYETEQSEPPIVSVMGKVEQLRLNYGTIKI
ncbi:glycoside hydrolase family 32 protein [Enterococcus plantarum]|uniref:glycoside hydrolase family 32 protein n=1 Tax=Enterococcus plantarum TaxID=1077675 RepID=UPI001A8CD753|nr:glycoside hydrolase family 32 protein [Enterococcus plantarum]MBO0424059.1 glycoside hydrolase family 32 protein [Enterococcus plantarum]